MATLPIVVPNGAPAEWQASILFRPSFGPDRRVMSVDGEINVSSRYGVSTATVSVPVALISALMRTYRPRIVTGWGWDDLDPGGVVGDVVDAAESTAEQVGDAAAKTYEGAKDLFREGGEKAKDVAPMIAPGGVAAANMFGAIMKGEDPLQALYDSAKWQWDHKAQSMRYAAIVASFVPGVGSGVASALAAGAALAEGKTIDEALIDAAAAALPGGLAARMAFNTAREMYRGKSITQAALSAARAELPPAQRVAFDVGLALAQGQSLQTAAISAAKEVMPGGPGGKAALDFALRVAKGESVTSAAMAAGGPLAMNAVKATIFGATPLEMQTAIAAARNALTTALQSAALKEGGAFGTQAAAVTSEVQRAASMLARARTNPSAAAQVADYARRGGGRVLDAAAAILQGDRLHLVPASTPYGPTQWDLFRHWVRRATGVSGASVGRPDAEFVTGGEYLPPPGSSPGNSALSADQERAFLAQKGL